MHVILKSKAYYDRAQILGITISPSKDHTFQYLSLKNCLIDELLLCSISQLLSVFDAFQVLHTQWLKQREGTVS